MSVQEPRSVCAARAASATPAPITTDRQQNSNFFRVLMTAIKVASAFLCLICFITLVATRDEEVRSYCAFYFLVFVISWVIDPNFTQPQATSTAPTPRQGGFDLTTLLSPLLAPQPAANTTFVRAATPLTLPSSSPTATAEPGQQNQ